MIYPNNSEDALRVLEYQRTDGYGELSRDVAGRCDSCGEEIYDGDDCLSCRQGLFCRRCIMAMTSEDIVELLGFYFEAAHGDMYREV